MIQISSVDFMFSSLLPGYFVVVEISICSHSRICWSSSGDKVAVIVTLFGSLVHCFWAAGNKEYKSSDTDTCITTSTLDKNKKL